MSKVSHTKRSKKRRRGNSEQAAAARGGSEAHVSEENMSSEDSPWTEEDSGEDYQPEKERPCNGTGGHEKGHEEESEEEEEAVDYDASQWKSRSGTMLWSPSHETTLPFYPPAISTPGPTPYARARITSPESAFDLFFPDEIMQILLRFTNQQGRKSWETWKEVSMQEMRAYLGLLILAGVFKSHRESLKSLWNNDIGRAIFGATMPVNRFLYINQAVRFRDKQSRQSRDKRDKLAPIRDLWDRWSRRLPMMFKPGRDICVDEQLVRFRGRCSFRQYMPSKPAKYGLKIWALCDVETSYAWRLQVYLGRSAGDPVELNQGMRVVLDLTDGLKGRTVTTDKFFTSFPLAEELRKRNMTLVGTLRHNKPELPLQVLKAQHREVLSSVFAFMQNKVVVSYVPRKRKNVLLLSTRHREPEVEESGKKKPQIILDYNKCKGGVDRIDQACGAYSCRWKTRRWPMCLFYHMMDVSCFNAYVLLVATDPSWRNKRRLFMQQLGRSLVAPSIASRSRLPRGSFAASLVLQARADREKEDEGKEDGGKEDKGKERQPPGNKRKKCFLCSNRKRVWSKCDKCEENACKVHLVLVCDSCFY